MNRSQRSQDQRAAVLRLARKLEAVIRNRARFSELSTDDCLDAVNAVVRRIREAE